MGHLISSTSMLQAAREQGFGITAFNVHTLEMLQAVVEAAETPNLRSFCRQRSAP